MAKLRIPAMLVLFSAAAVIEAFRLVSLSSLNNADIWWHLSSGLWMLQHHAVPHVGICSQSSAQPWIASSWAYDLLLAVAYKLLGLRAIPWLLMCFKEALAVLTFVLAGGTRGRFWPAIGMSVVAQYILGAVQPGPAYFSTLFFGIELLILLEARRSEDGRWLWWLPLLFLVWANLHVQFVYGVVVLLLFLGAVAIEHFQNVSASLSVAQIGKIVGASLAATVVTPYLYGSYAVFFKTTFNSANKYLPDFQALGFRQSQDYLLLLLAMSAFLTLGLRRSRDPFQIALLASALGLSFYAQRDIWLVVLASLSIIGDAFASGSVAKSEVLGETLTLRRPILIAVSAGVVLVIFAFVLCVPRSERSLLAKAGQTYPVAACDYIREHRLGQPLFNAYEWGGFLTWYLPEYPAAIDSRADLYGAKTVTAYSKVMNAELPYREYPAIADAQTILLPKKANMAAALGSVPGFQVSYSDEVSVVLTPRNTP
jgi:hypothetical protein